MQQVSYLTLYFAYTLLKYIIKMLSQQQYYTETKYYKYYANK